MSFQGTLSADGNTQAVVVDHNDGVHITADGTWGGGTITLQINRNGTWGTAYYSTGTAITFTAGFNELFDFRKGDEIRLNLSGSTSPTLPYTIR